VIDYSQTTFRRTAESTPQGALAIMVPFHTIRSADFFCALMTLDDRFMSVSSKMRSEVRVVP
jgi:hypothetical protein